MGNGAEVLSNRQRKILVKQIKAQKASEPRPEPVYTPPPEVHVVPQVDGENTVHVQGISGKTIALKLDTLHKLWRQGRISGELYSAGQLYLGIVQTYYETSSGLSRLSEEAPSVSTGADPIRLYNKGRRVYVATQRPRNVVKPKTSFDGWTTERSGALKALHRVRAALRFVDPEALRILYALVIHPSDPHRRPTTLRAYVITHYAYRNQRVEDRVIRLLGDALEALYREFGEVLERKAA